MLNSHLVSHIPVWLTLIGLGLLATIYTTVVSDYIREPNNQDVNMFPIFHGAYVRGVQVRSSGTVAIYSTFFRADLKL